MDPGHLGRAFHGGAHYENFPVASWLLPAGMRPAMLALYQFARTGDDLADEGALPRAARLAGLDALHAGLTGAPQPADRSGDLAALYGIGGRLRAALMKRSISVRQAQRLLKAFQMDVEHTPAESEAGVLEYCSHSANPIGRLVLAIAGVIADPDTDCEATRHSDAICSGLQLVNFAQDLGQDFSRGRIYTPRDWWPEDWRPHQAAAGLTDDQRVRLATRMAQWGAEAITAGRPLISLIKASPAAAPRRLALEIALVIEGGRWIARAVHRRPLGVWQASPRISRAELPVILLRAINTYFQPNQPA